MVTKSPLVVNFSPPPPNKHCKYLGLGFPHVKFPLLFDRNLLNLCKNSYSLYGCSLQINNLYTKQSGVSIISGCQDGITYLLICYLIKVDLNSTIIVYIMDRKELLVVGRVSYKLLSLLRQ